MTDGITDAADRRDRRFGEARLRRALRAHAGQDAESALAGIVAALDAFSDGTPQAEDLTRIALRRTD